LVAREGGFFSGRAQRRPDVFRGEMGNWARREPRFFVTAASGGVYGKIKEQPTSEELFLFEGFNGRLGQSSSSRLVAPGRSFKLEGKKDHERIITNYTASVLHLCA
jgi:hypothetical protein